MALSRISTCLSDGSLTLPDTGQIAVYGATADTDLGALPQERTEIIATGFADHSAFEQAGWTSAVAATGPYAAAIIILPRAKDLARAWLRDAGARVPRGGLLVVDGQKTDGVESMLKAVRSAQRVDGQTSKAHGKLFWFQRDATFDNWPDLSPSRNSDGFLTAPGVFSADGVDPASRLLADTLPQKMSGAIADLGAGWGYLAGRILERPAPQAVHLIENDAVALDCARANLSDDRAQFHWADATTWSPPALMDVVVTNPPFHTGRTADPALGQAFLRTAARILKPSGQLWLVANRHLPYETTLSALFRHVEQRGGDGRFKVLLAEKPSNTRRKPG